MNGRMYDPLVGRMLSPDNIIQAGDATQLFNRYSYCANNPLKYIDPSGNDFGYDDLVVSGVGFLTGYISYGVTTHHWGGKAVVAGLEDAAIAEIGYLTLGGGNLTSGVFDTNLGDNGNIGIGKTNPNSKLDIAGSINATNYLIGGQPFTTSQWQNSTYNLNDIYYTQGNVGIGTSNPSFNNPPYEDRLVVDGNFRVQNTCCGWQYGNIEMGFDGYHSWLQSNTPGSHGLLINSNGESVGFGGEISCHVLDVAPDYVFEKNYKPMSLEEIENYVNANKHLPEIPSAKEIEKKGISVGDFSLGLLKKVEELTLYMIELEKKNNGMAKEIEKLKKKK